MSIYQSIVNEDKKLRRGLVFCHKCGKKLKVDSAQCLAKGWPKCCDSTMSLDEPSPALLR